MFKLVLEKAEELEIKLPTSFGSLKKQESSRKTSISALLTMPKPLIVWITTNCGKFLKRWEYQTTWSVSWETGMQVKKQYLELDMKQRTGSKLGKEYVKAVYWHPAYLTSMQSTSWEMKDWKKHKLESRLAMKVKEESEKVGLELNIEKTKIMASISITSWEIDGETVETVSDFIFGGLQNHCRWFLWPWN